MVKEKTMNYETFVTEPTEDQLVRLSNLVHNQLELESQIKTLEHTMKNFQAQLRQVSEVDIPNLLDETGLSEVKLRDGTKVVVREDLRVSTTGKNRDVINRWLTEIGCEDLIRDEVVASFNRGEGERAEELLRHLTLLGVLSDRKRYVNPQSFAALLREMRDKGEDVPLERLGVFVQRRAQLK
jgi:hypothetical protein